MMKKSMSDLVAMYNGLITKNGLDLPKVKKFSTKKDGIKRIEKLKKAEKIENPENLPAIIEGETVKDLTPPIVRPKKKPMKRAKIGRKQQVLTLLENGHKFLDKIAETIGITNKNVSSQLTYLRRDGYTINTLIRNGRAELELVTENE